MEKILTENPNRFVLFPIQHEDLWKLYKQAQSCFWTAEEIDLQQDLTDWERLNDGEKYFVKNVLAFFAASEWYCKRKSSGKLPQRSSVHRGNSSFTVFKL